MLLSRDEELVSAFFRKQGVVGHTARLLADVSREQRCIVLNLTERVAHEGAVGVAVGIHCNGNLEAW